MTEWLINIMKKSNFLSLDSLSLQDFDENSELIPLMTPEDEELINNESLPESLPILPLRNTVLFPGVVIPITAGRDTSIKLINDANKSGKVIGVVAQKDEAVENPKAKDIYNTGTVARILKVLKCLMVIQLLLFRARSDLELMKSFLKSRICQQQFQRTCFGRTRFFCPAVQLFVPNP